MTQQYFDEHIQYFLLEYEGNAPARDYSYDYCQLYFSQHDGDFIIHNLEQSCFVLWGYLAGFGMLRGSSPLLSKNPTILVPVIEFIAAHQLNDIDLGDYCNEVVRQRIIDGYQGIEQCLQPLNPSPTLITKIMLGVYTCIPAFDSYFVWFMKNQWGLRINANHFDAILQRIYEEFNHIEFPHLYLRQFNGEDSNIIMKKIRFIDRLGWEIGA